MQEDPGLNALIDTAVGTINGLVEHWLKKREKKEDQKNEVEALTAALGIELASLVNAILGRRAWWLREEKKEEWLPPLVPFYTDAYDQIRNRIEKLPPDIVAATVRFHGYLRFVNGLHDVMKEYQQAGRRERFREIYQNSLDHVTRIGIESLKVFEARVKGKA